MIIKVRTGDLGMFMAMKREGAISPINKGGSRKDGNWFSRSIYWNILS